MKRIILIGSGNVASHLGFALKKSNYQITQVYSRELENAKKLAERLGADATNKFQALTTSDLIIVSVTDAAIAEVLDELNDVPIVHTSGSIDLAIFGDKFEKFGVLYPVQTFNKNIELDFLETPICIEANNTEFENELLYLASCISTKVVSMNSSQRKQLHIAAVFASNFSNHMFTLADDVLKNAQLEFSLLLPLIQQTIKKLEDNKAKNVQTGPAKRKDMAVIQEHLNNIQDKDIRELYTKISSHIIKTHE